MPNEVFKGKLDSRAKICFMVGYCTNGYHLWCLREQKIVFGRDIIFEETKFIADESFFTQPMSSLKKKTEIKKSLKKKTEIKKSPKPKK